MLWHYDKRSISRTLWQPEEIVRQQAAARAADDRAARAVDLDADIPTGPQVLGYNDFWFETQGLDANVRTSHIVYPANGLIPPSVEGAKVQRGNLSLIHI